MHSLVVLYSVNVFLTFTLSLTGLVRHGLANRGERPRWRRRLAIALLAWAVADRLRDLVPDYFSCLGASHHYFNWARRTYRERLAQPRVNHKRYLYALRPLLAVRWIEQDRGVVPMEFERLLATDVNEFPTTTRSGARSTDCSAWTRRVDFTRTLPA